MTFENYICILFFLDIKSDKGGRWNINTGAEQWSDIGGGLFTVGCGEKTQYGRA